MNRPEILVFVGARPNIPKAWTLLRALQTVEYGDRRERIEVHVVHSGQHYHELLGVGFANRFGIKVSANLEVGSANSDAEQVANLLVKIDSIFTERTPVCVVVLGDVNTTVAAALAASRRNIPVVHLEAGLRAGEWDPEEINRKVITAVSRYHLAPSKLAVSNLLREGVDKSRIFLVGNTMAETFKMHEKERLTSSILEELGVSAREYVLFTVHKSHNLTRFQDVVKMLTALAHEKTVVFPCHPHTQNLLREHMNSTSISLNNVIFTDPLGYADIGRLIEDSWCTVTDSAGMQEECTVAGIPCLTIGTGTARPETVYSGTNQIVGYDVERLIELVKQPPRVNLCPFGWDDKVSERLQAAFVRILQELQKESDKTRWIIRPSVER